MAEKMTLHRALMELKLLGSKIKKGVDTLVVVGVQQKGKKVNSLYDLEEFNKQAKADYQSITDLITRREKIKAAIVQANSTIKVKIGEKEYTLADAINFKAVVVIKQELLGRLSQQFKLAAGDLNKKNEEIKAQAVRITEITLGKSVDKNNAKDTDVLATMDQFITNNNWSLVDPVGIEQTIKNLENEVLTFMADVDAVLSEANAINFIEL